MKYQKSLFLILAGVLILVFAGYVYVNYFGGKMPTGSVTLSWNASEDPAVAGYKIYYGTVPRIADCPGGGYGQSIDARKSNQYALERLKIGQKYYFSVTSYNSSGRESCFSEEMSKEVGFPWPAWIKRWLKK